MDRDRNLLFGIFAVQLFKVSPSQLVEAAALWAADSSRPLVERLIDLGALQPRDREFLDSVVERAIAAHEGDVAATLQSFGGEERVCQTFRGSIRLTETGGIETIRPAEPLVGPVQYLDAEQVPGVQETPGRYSHISEYGRGGMGRVLLVHDAFLGRDVALKELLLGPINKATSDSSRPLMAPVSTSEDPSTPSTQVRSYMDMLGRFLQEARITGQLEHPSIVPVYELGHRKDGTLY